MWKSVLLFVTCFVYFIHSKLIITNFDYQTTRDGVVLRCLYDNGVPEKRDRVEFFVNNSLLYSFDPKSDGGQQTLHTAIDGVQLDSEHSNSTHLALKQVGRVTGMFKCEVRSAKTIERTKVERKFVFDLPSVGYLRWKQRAEQLEAIRAQSPNETPSTPFSATKEITPRPDDSVANQRMPTIHRPAGQPEMLIRQADSGRLTNGEENASRAVLTSRSVERPDYHRQRPKSGSSSAAFVILNRGDTTHADAFSRVKKEESAPMAAYKTNRPSNVRLANPMPRFAGNLNANRIQVNSEEQDAQARRQSRIDRTAHDPDGSHEIPLTQQELESSNEIIMKDFLSYWTRINLVKLYSEIATIKRRIGLQPRPYPNHIQP